jgi:hypothetical protein
MLSILFNPALIGMTALFLSVVWMLRNEKDRTRPLLVIALVINLFYGWLLSFVMGHENGVVPWKYDHVLLNLDHALGIPGAAIAQILQQARIPLQATYELMVPMMIAWFLVARRHGASGSIVVAYVAQIIAGPLLYAILPACGPLYAFHGQWLHPPAVQATLVRLSGMPNAFPSLHTATALLFVSFARGRLWQILSVAFLAGTLMATVAMGEHYVIDLVAGLAFGCFAANAGRRNIARSLAFLSLVLAWSLAVRFAPGFLIGHAPVLQLFAGLTVLAALVDTVAEWRTDISESPSVVQQMLQPST